MRFLFGGKEGQDQAENRSVRWVKNIMRAPLWVKGPPPRP